MKKTINIKSMTIPLNDENHDQAKYEIIHLRTNQAMQNNISKKLYPGQ